MGTPPPPATWPDLQIVRSKEENRNFSHEKHEGVLVTVVWGEGYSLKTHGRCKFEMSLFCFFFQTKNVWRHFAAPCSYTIQIAHAEHVANLPANHCMCVCVCVEFLELRNVFDVKNIHTTFTTSTAHRPDQIAADDAIAITLFFIMRVLFACLANLLRLFIH